jgi:hypothetical protein
MSGASAATRRVAILNANWTTPPDGHGDGQLVADEPE